MCLQSAENDFGSVNINHYKLGCRLRFVSSSTPQVSSEIALEKFQS